MSKRQSPDDTNKVLLGFAPFFEKALDRLESPMVIFVVFAVVLLLVIFVILPFFLLVENANPLLGVALIIGVAFILVIVAVSTGALYYARMKLGYSNQTEEQLKEALRDTVGRLLEEEARQASSALVQITYVEYDPLGNDVQGEFVRIANSGKTAIDLVHWTLSDESGLRFTFPPLVLEPRRYVRVWTKIGANTNSDLYWGKRQTIWNNEGDCASLRDSTGKLVDTYCWSRRAGEVP